MYMYWPELRETLVRTMLDQLLVLKTLYLANTIKEWKSIKEMIILFIIIIKVLVQTVLVTWPKWPPCSYMVKTFKNILLWNQKADDIETWYAASGAWVLPSLFK